MNIDPVINSALTVLNGSMLLCLVIVIMLGRRRLRKSRQAVTPLTLLTEPRQCLLGFKRLGHARDLERCHHFHLPALSKEDHL